MENVAEGIFTQLLIKLQEQAIIERANLLHKNHMENLRNLLISGAKLNEMNVLYNSLFRKNLAFGAVADANADAVANADSEKEKDNKTKDSSITDIPEGEESSQKKISLKQKPIRFIIQRDKKDESSNFLEKKNFLVKEVQKENSEKMDKKFICNMEHCQKEYRSKENLILHIKNKHNDEKPYFCKFCSKKYSHRSGKFKFFFYFFTIFTKIFTKILLDIIFFKFLC